MQHFKLGDRVRLARIQTIRGIDLDGDSLEYFFKMRPRVLDCITNKIPATITKIFYNELDDGDDDCLIKFDKDDFIVGTYFEELEPYFIEEDFIKYCEEK